MKTNPLQRLLGGLAVAGAIAVAVTAPARSEDFSKSPRITLRLTSASPPSMDDSKALVETAEHLGKATGGTVTLKPYFSSALFDEIAGMSAAQSGLVDMAIACTCNMTKLTDSMMFSDLPYLWSEMDNGRTVWGGPLGKSIREDLTKQTGLIPVAFAPSGGGYRILWNNRGEVKVPADAKGLKIRTVATPIEQEFWTRVGAIPTPVDIGETYSALQTRLVDGEHLQPAWLTLLKHDEVTKYGTEINALAVYRVLVINQASYGRMDDAEKKAFGEAMTFYEDRAYAYNRELRDSSLKSIRARGGQIYTPTPAELEQWRKIGQSMYQSDVVKRYVPQAVIEQALAEQGQGGKAVAKQ